MTVAISTPGSGKVREHQRRFWAAVVVLVFVASRAVYRFALDVPFDPTPLYKFLQLADAELLETRLAETLWYLHGQAPLLNLIGGLALKLSSSYAWLILEIAFFLIGLGMAVGLYTVLCRLRWPSSMAALLASAYMASPLVVTYERWFLYHHLIAALLVGIAAAWLRFAERRTLARGMLLFALVGAVVMTRNLFGLTWVAALLLGLFVFRVAPARRLLLCAAPLCVLLIGFSTKQLVLFGTFGAGDAFMGPNLAVRLLGSELPYKRQELRQIDPIFRIRPVAEVDRYRDIVALPEPTGIPILDRPRTSSGSINLNHKAYLRIGDRYAKASASVIWDQPDLYLESVARALRFGYFRSASQDNQVRNATPYVALEGPIGWVDRALGYRGEHGQGWLLIVCYPAILMGASVRLIARAWHGRANRHRDALDFFLLVTIIYVSATTVMVSWGDFGRYRYDLDPLYMLLGASLLSHGYRQARGAVRRWRASRRTSKPVAS